MDDATRGAAAPSAVAPGAATPGAATTGAKPIPGGSAAGVARGSAAPDPAAVPASETAIDERLHLIGQLPLQARAAAFAELHDDLRDQLEQSDATQPRD